MRTSSTRRTTFMERFARRNANVSAPVGPYDPLTQTAMPVTASPSLRTNYPTWNQTQQTTNQHTANGDIIPDFPGDQEPDFAQD